MRAVSGTYDQGTVYHINVQTAAVVIDITPGKD